MGGSYRFRSEVNQCSAMQAGHLLPSSQWRSRLSAIAGVIQRLRPLGGIEPTAKDAEENASVGRNVRQAASRRVVQLGRRPQAEISKWVATPKSRSSSSSRVDRSSALVQRLCRTMSSATWE